MGRQLDSTIQVSLREVVDADLDIFFNQQLDQLANKMAAFTSRDSTNRDEFMKHWSTILRDKNVKVKTIMLSHGEVAGHVARYVDPEFGKPEVTYWIGREYWGKGIATNALSLFLEREEVKRPIYARVAVDNKGSKRVLEKCGFKIFGREKSYANARGQEIEELIMELG